MDNYIGYYKLLADLAKMHYSDDQFKISKLKKYQGRHIRFKNFSEIPFEYKKKYVRVAIDRLAELKSDNKS